jgi:DNA polymerase III epsilon subunit family exonuclease
MTDSLAYLLFIGIAFFILYTIARGYTSSATSSAVDLSVLPAHFIVLDLETTGLDPERHKIIEIGAIRVNRDSTRHDTFRALIKIQGTVPAKITNITGITTEILAADGEVIETALPQFIEFIGDLRLVTFNAPFDIGFLGAAARAQGLTIKNPCSCALDMARRAWPGRKSYKLSALTKNLGAGKQNHRALDDCQLALTVYGAAASKLRRIS